MLARAVVLTVVMAAAAAAVPFAPTMVDPTAITQAAAYNNTNVTAVLTNVSAVGYDTPIQILTIHTDSHYQAGFAYGHLLGGQIESNLESLFNSLLSNKLEQDVLKAYLEWQFEEYLAKHTPQKYLDELKGVEDGAKGAGFDDAGKAVRLGVTIASIVVGDLKDDILYLLRNELLPEELVARVSQAQIDAEELIDGILSSRIVAMFKTCSMWGAWGPRTDQGELFTGRNLDWAADTGVAKYKVITVYKFKNAHPYASISFAGVVGAITGMSSAGMTVHEAGDDSTEVTLKGFAWSLRLRELMETTANLSEAKAFWKSTSNTMGINHGIGSASDKRFIALETNAKYTAFFDDNDPREANLTVDGKKYGFPLKNALWRTNHGYDPEFLKDHVGGAKPDTDSFNRYKLFHDTFQYYESTKTLISQQQALNLTAMAGDKGGSSTQSFLSCVNASQGENIISATFSPWNSVMFVAFENGHGDKHVPACCNSYVRLDMKKWFS